MEIVIRDNLKRSKAGHRKTEKVLRKALEYLEARSKLLTPQPPLGRGGSKGGYSSLPFEVSVLFVGDGKMHALNLRYRGIDKTTDVLSFPQYDGGELKKMLKRSSQVSDHSSLPLGDIVISLERTRAQAKEHGLSFDEELARLLIHGLLHLFGYDHEKSAYQARKMRKMEGELLNAVEKVDT